MTRLLAPPEAEQAAPGGRLELLDTLFRRLADEAIPYCHWKSNEHLGLSLAGGSDIDVLIAREAAVRLARLLAELDFKHFLVKPGQGYPGIEDYLGFDPATGRLTHLHVHYQLTLGEKFLKGHRLPWEHIVLATRVRDPVHDVFVADPNMEALLLLTRAAMKLRTRDSLLAAANAPYIRGSQLRELRWLAARVDYPRLLSLANELVGEGAARQLPAMLGGAAPTIRQLRAFRRLARPHWRVYRMYGRGEALLRRWQREAATIVRVVRNRLRSSALRSSTRTAPRGGLLVALVGPDGAGKTTVAREITRWLSREVAVLPLYGGSGSGPASLTRRALQLVARAARAFRRPTPARARGDGRLARAENGGAALRGARALAYATWALALARERRRGARRARGVRDRGLVVVADRYPQCQFGGLNDGPKLWHLRAHRSALLRWAAAREHEAYADVERLAPDLVVKLLLPAHVALRRKPDTPADRLHHKVRVVAALSYPPCTQVAETDATRPLNEVLLCIKAAIWRAL